MDQRNIPWKAEWKAAGLDPGPLSAEEEALVSQLQQENREFLLRHPYRPVPKPRRLKLSLPTRVWTLPLAAAAALVVFFTVPWPNGQGPADGLERMKGGKEPVLVVYRQGGSGNEKLTSGSVVRPGDVLQAAYRVSEGLQGALLSIDGSGNVTTHLAREGRSVSLAPGAERPLDFGYELDRAPRFEVFVLLVSRQSFDLEPIRQILKATPWNRLKADAFGSQIQFTVVALNKELQ